MRMILEEENRKNMKEKGTKQTSRKFPYQRKIKLGKAKVI